MEGILLINKTKNKTSRDMVNELNHIFNMKKIGHTGTLDPIATGVLVMCFGKYTKLVDKLSSLKKEYVAEIKLGVKTDTLDITGTVLETKKCSIQRENVINVLNNLIGIYEQEVPIYSAKSVNGKRLYEYARNNEAVKIPINEVEIFDLKLISIKKDIITIKCCVSKGTYIRSLIQSICKNLNIIGTMNNLIRTKQGKFNIKDSYAIDDVKNNKYTFLLARDILDYKEYILTEGEYTKVKNGNKMNFNSIEENLILIYENKEIAIYKKEKELYRADIMLL